MPEQRYPQYAGRLQAQVRPTPSQLNAMNVMPSILAKSQKAIPRWRESLLPQCAGKVTAVR